MARTSTVIAMHVETADYHTAGEPFRIVTGGVPAPEGATVLDRRSAAMTTHDDVRALIVNEPRGHADMYGGFVTPPDDPGAALGVVFFHKDGFSTACGHGTIALTTWALEHGIVPAVSPVTELAVDVPSGRLAVAADVRVEDGRTRVGEVRFTNVASFVTAEAVTVHAAGRDWVVDVSYGGAFYASCDVRQAGVTIEPAHLGTLIELGRAIKWAVDAHPAVRHPGDDRLSGCYGTIWWEDRPVGGPVTSPGPGGEVSGAVLHQRNVTIFADGEVDRSPCGSGTSARLALLHAQGRLATGALLRHTSVVGSTFSGRVLSTTEVHDGIPAVITQVGGRASQTGTHTFVLDPDDEVGLGFQLR